MENKTLAQRKKELDQDIDVAKNGLASAINSLCIEFKTLTGLTVQAINLTTQSFGDGNAELVKVDIKTF